MFIGTHKYNPSLHSCTKLYVQVSTWSPLLVAVGLGSVGGWQSSLRLLQATVAWHAPSSYLMFFSFHLFQRSFLFNVFSFHLFQRSFSFNVFFISPFSKSLGHPLCSASRGNAHIHLSQQQGAFILSWLPNANLPNSSPGWHGFVKPCWCGRFSSICLHWHSAL